MDNDRAGFEEPVETEDLELDSDGEMADLEGVMRDAVAAVEQVKENQRARGEETVQDAGEGGEEQQAVPAPEHDVAEEVEALRQELADQRDRSVRTLADFDNFRKRARREQEEARRYAAMEPLREFLDVVDNLERALQADGSLEDLKAGVEMILRQVKDVLKQLGVRTVPARGETFDPNVHEAVAREEDSGVEMPTVIEELQRGYLFQDRLLRPARVKVALPAEAAAGAPRGVESRDG